jgi:hypothetical protein
MQLRLHASRSLRSLVQNPPHGAPLRIADLADGDRDA